ncbi:MAG: hypothetical protein U0973_11515, partial [Xanthomonadaceae bacterium]|nr:hypothetical protein [Xanthomonadaceae bacterium]
MIAQRVDNHGTRSWHTTCKDEHITVRRPNRMIRDTAAQDRLLSPPSPNRRRLLIVAAIAAAALTLIGLLARWASAERSIDGNRVRIAEVTRGTLVRDATVNGRVVAAVSP